MSNSEQIELMGWVQHFRKAHNLVSLDGLIMSARRKHPEAWPLIEQAAEHREAEINMETFLPLDK
ncbi:MAG: hypothetical protein KAY06_04715 [Aeromonadaceae bacterium]|nr:hypothetical protein [Aeromonadaceae bacterium]